MDLDEIGRMKALLDTILFYEREIFRLRGQLKDSCVPQERIAVIQMILESAESTHAALKKRADLESFTQYSEQNQDSL